jgi:hypothetical protein
MTVNLLHAMGVGIPDTYIKHDPVRRGRGNEMPDPPNNTWAHIAATASQNQRSIAETKVEVNTPPTHQATLAKKPPAHDIPMNPATPPATSGE